MSSLHQTLRQELTKGSKADDAHNEVALLLQHVFGFGLKVKGHGSIERLQVQACPGERISELSSCEMKDAATIRERHIYTCIKRYTRPEAAGRHMFER